MTTVIGTNQDVSLLVAKNPSNFPTSIRATYDGRLIVSSVNELNPVNYSYDIIYNGSGMISSEHRTFNSVTQIKTYTYDGSGNLTGESAWV